MHYIKKEEIMNKIEYFESLNEIVDDKVFIGMSLEDLKTEISINMWGIGILREIVETVSVSDFIVFFEKVLANRQQQLNTSSSNHGMSFYAWVDHQAGQLRFNLISDLHSRLPFGSDIEMTNRLEPIIEEFLSSPFLEGTPVDDSIDYRERTAEGSFVQKVYLKCLSKQVQ
jgi:hypothetical protein